MARTDFYDDPNAPTPNSIVPAAVGCVTDDQGRILLEHRVDNDLWALPGGTHDYDCWALDLYNSLLAFF